MPLCFEFRGMFAHIWGQHKVNGRIVSNVWQLESMSLSKSLLQPLFVILTSMGWWFFCMFLVPRHFVILLHLLHAVIFHSSLSRFCSILYTTAVKLLGLLLLKLTVPQPAKKSTAFNGNGRFITVFRGSFSSNFFKIRFNIILPSSPRFSKCFVQVSPSKP